jgi:hypothetical protein
MRTVNLSLLTPSFLASFRKSLTVSCTLAFLEIDILSALVCPVLYESVNMISLLALSSLHLCGKPIEFTEIEHAISTLPWKFAVRGYEITMIEET